MSLLNDQQKHDLENMIEANETENVTQDIRTTKKVSVFMPILII